MLRQLNKLININKQYIALNRYFTINVWEYKIEYNKNIKEREKNDMKLLITGGAGYIGSVSTNLALQQGYQVKVIDTLWFKKDIPLIHLNNPNY